MGICNCCHPLIRQDNISEQPRILPISDSWWCVTTCTHAMNTVYSTNDNRESSCHSHQVGARGKIIRYYLTEGLVILCICSLASLFIWSMPKKLWMIIIYCSSHISHTSTCLMATDFQHILHQVRTHWKCNDASPSGFFVACATLWRINLPLIGNNQTQKN